MLKKIRVIFGITTFFFLYAISPLLAANDTSITGLDGKASIMRNGQILPAQMGTPLEAGDEIRTEDGSTADFSMNAVAGIRVLSSSQCKVSDATLESMKVHVKAGKLLLNLDKLSGKSTFQVETPTAVAVVRGTQFSVSVDALKIDNPISTFAVRDGNVEVFTPATHETFMLHPGQAIDIPKDLIKTPEVRQAIGNELRSLEQSSLVKTC